MSRYHNQSVIKNDPVYFNSLMYPAQLITDRVKRCRTTFIMKLAVYKQSSVALLASSRESDTPRLYSSSSNRFMFLINKTAMFQYL